VLGDEREAVHAELIASLDFQALLLTFRDSFTSNDRELKRESNTCARVAGSGATVMFTFFRDPIIVATSRSSARVILRVADMKLGCAEESEGIHINDGIVSFPENRSAGG